MAASGADTARHRLLTQGPMAMDCNLRPIMNDKIGHLVPATRHAISIRSTRWLGSTALSGGGHLAVLRLAAALVLALRPSAYALPTNGTVAAGSVSYTHLRAHETGRN